MEKEISIRALKGMEEKTIDLLFWDGEHCFLDEGYQTISIFIEDCDFLDRLQGFCFPSIAALRVLGASESSP